MGMGISQCRRTGRLTCSAKIMLYPPGRNKGVKPKINTDAMNTPGSDERDRHRLFESSKIIGVCEHPGKNPSHRPRLHNGEDENSSPTSAVLCGKLYS